MYYFECPVEIQTYCFQPRKSPLPFYCKLFYFPKSVDASNSKFEQIVFKSLFLCTKDYILDFDNGYNG